MVITHPKFPFSVKVPIETNDGLFFYVSFSQEKIISYKNKEGIPAKIQGLYIQRKKINYSNNTELMTDEPHSIYKPDMDAYLSKKNIWFLLIVIRKINIATTINELNLIKYNPIWKNVLNNKNDIKELFNK